MHWILQKNVFQEYGYERLIHCLEDLLVPYGIVDIVPFSHELIPEMTPSGPVFVSGSTALVQVASDRGWGPGIFIGPNFEFESWRSGYSGFLLNADAEVCRFADVMPRDQPFFARPTRDTKAFPGAVFDWSDFADLRAGILAAADPFNPLQPHTEVLIASPKTVIDEYRFFVVDGRVITGSPYVLNGRRKHIGEVPAPAWEFARQMVAQWVPVRAFVIDVARTPDDYKVVEINSINSAGFYDAEVGALVKAIEAMEFANT